VVHQLHLRLGDDLRIVFRHYPLTHKHSHAQAAAEAAEAAGAQGRFWEMHDLLFTRRDALELWDPESLAEELKIDPVRFSANLRGHVFLDRVRQSARDARESGVSQTPTFFINGELYEGEHDFDSMLHVLNALRPVPGREFTV
jgi:protein-disulfide isomerase